MIRFNFLHCYTLTSSTRRAHNPIPTRRGAKKTCNINQNPRRRAEPRPAERLFLTINLLAPPRAYCTNLRPRSRYQSVKVDSAQTELWRIRRRLLVRHAGVLATVLASTAERTQLDEEHDGVDGDSLVSQYTVTLRHCLTTSTTLVCSQATRAP